MNVSQGSLSLQEDLGEQRQRIRTDQAGRPLVEVAKHRKAALVSSSNKPRIGVRRFHLGFSSDMLLLKCPDGLRSIHLSFSYFYVQVSLSTKNRVRNVLSTWTCRLRSPKPKRRYQLDLESKDFTERALPNSFREEREQAWNSRK